MLYIYTFLDYIFLNKIQYLSENVNVYSNVIEYHTEQIFAVAARSSYHLVVKRLGIAFVKSRDNTQLDTEVEVTPRIFLLIIFFSDSCTCKFPLLIYF